MSPLYIGAQNTSNKFLGNLSSNPGTGVAGDQYFNTVSNRFRFYDGTQWIQLNPASLGGSSATPAESAAALIADGQTQDGYYWIQFPNEPAATQRWCDLTDGYMLISHWSPNGTTGSGDASPTPGSTSYATSYGGFSGVTADAVAAPGSSEATSDWVWDADTRGTQTGGSFFRNSSSNGTNPATSGSRSYIPKTYGFSWQYAKWGVRVSVPGGTAANTSGGDGYNSMDNFSPGTQDIDQIYVDGLSITQGPPSGGGGRGHIFTINVNGTNTNGNNAGGTPAFVSGGNGNINMNSHPGTNTSSFNEYNNNSSPYNKGSATDGPFEMRLQSDQTSANECIYCRAWYVLIK